MYVRRLLPEKIVCPCPEFEPGTFSMRVRPFAVQLTDSINTTLPHV